MQGYQIAYSIVATDSLGQTATATLTMKILEVNKPPVFSAPTYAYTIREGTAVNELVARLPFSPIATDQNLRQTLVYRLVSSNPAPGNRTFFVDQNTCVIHSFAAPRLHWCSLC